MQQKPSSPIPTPTHLPRLSETPSTAAPDDPTTSSLFDWSDFLDFNLDENLTISFDHPDQPGLDQSQLPGKVRKRDPRLVCSNFLAGRVPCACPELDEKLEEEESALPGKKRARTVRAPGGGPARCQVPACEADITELKGYHKRHRVCLKCANASEVVLDGESKRYCQQCGKFHILSDFDEGKRSCRRKLERHNNRRRRKPNDSKESMEKDAQHIILADDVGGDDDAGKDRICVSSQIEERESLLELEGQLSGLCSAPAPQKSDSVASFAASDEPHIDREKQNPKFKRSASYCYDKSAFSSVCPAGRISFKLYDWNPAEFPRRLRHQIFQWLASMPVELEGYIRPGCTILTAFIAMPKPMWLKLLEEPAKCIKDLVASPGSMFSGRGTMLVHLNDMVFRVTEDATSVLKFKVKNRAPKLHYIFPTCFEAGRPMEFVACGSNLLQPNFRFLVSFAGRYLAYNICVSSECCEEGDAKNVDHQLLKIYVPQTDMDLSGPAFIEVENQSGLSNFIPILVGDKEICAGMEILQQKFEPRSLQQEGKLSPSPPWCEFFAVRQAQFSEFLLDVAWLLKKPVSEQQLTSSHIQRFNYLLHFLIKKESSVVLERVFCSLKSSVLKNIIAEVSDSDTRLLRKNMETAQSKLAQKLLEKDSSLMPYGNFCGHSSEEDDQSVGPANNQKTYRSWIDRQQQQSVIFQGYSSFLKNLMGIDVSSQSQDDNATVPLLKGEVIMNVDLHENPRKSCRRLLTRTSFTTRTLVTAIAAVGVCFGLCAVVLHPQGAGQLATTIRSCLFVNTLR